MNTVLNQDRNTRRIWGWTRTKTSDSIRPDRNNWSQTGIFAQTPSEKKEPENIEPNEGQYTKQLCSFAGLMLDSKHSHVTVLVRNTSSKQPNSLLKRKTVTQWEQWVNVTTGSGPVNCDGCLQQTDPGHNLTIHLHFLFQKTRSHHVPKSQFTVCSC